MSSEMERIHLKLYPDRGDPDQDLIVSWLNSLPRDPHGRLYRDVLRGHLIKSIAGYIRNGLTVPGAVPPALPATDAAEDRCPSPALRPPVVLPVAPAAEPVTAPPAPAAPAGGGLRGRFKKAMTNSENGTA